MPALNWSRCHAAPDSSIWGAAARTWVVWASPRDFDPWLNDAGFHDFCEGDEDPQIDADVWLSGAIERMSDLGKPRMLEGSPQGWPSTFFGLLPLSHRKILRDFCRALHDSELRCEVRFGEPPQGGLCGDSKLLWITLRSGDEDELKRVLEGSSPGFPVRFFPLQGPPFTG